MLGTLPWNQRITQCCRLEVVQRCRKGKGAENTSFFHDSGPVLPTSPPCSVRPRASSQATFLSCLIFSHHLSLLLKHQILFSLSSPHACHLLPEDFLGQWYLVLGSSFNDAASHWNCSGPCLVTLADFPHPLRGSSCPTPMRVSAEGQTPDLFGSLPTTSESLLLSCELLVSPFSVFRQQNNMILLSSENVLEGD